jgi:ABC-type glycerol-3-phosphate transport system permease component
MKASVKDITFDSLNILFLALFSIITFYPFYYVLIYSLSIPDEAVRGVYLLPRGFTLMNYIKVFTENNLYRAFLISMSRTVAGTVLTVVCSSMFAYGVSKVVLPFRRFMYRGLVLTMYFSVGIIPWYVTMRMYGLKNNFLLYILPGAVGAFYVVLLKTYFEQLPPSVEESAMMDGAGYFRIFMKIVFPLSTPIIATVALYSAVGQWNSWFDNFMLAPGEGLRTLPYILYIYLNSQSINIDTTNFSQASRLIRVTPTSIRITITVIVALPIFMLYPFLQKYFIKGLFVGSIKG